MRMKLLLAVTACSAALLSFGAFATPLCSTFPTLGSFGAGSTCVDDADSDLLFTFGSTNLPGSSTFSLGEAVIGGVDFYTVQVNFPANFSVGGDFFYSLSSLNTEQIFAANYDTDIAGSGTLGTKTIFDIAGNQILQLTSLNGSHDPLGGGETPFPAGPQSTIFVHDQLNDATGNGIYTSETNSFKVVVPQAPEPGTLLLVGLGLLGLAGMRRRHD